MPRRPGCGFTIVVSGMIAADPGQGGAAWAVLQYVKGLERLGHEVYLVEPIAESKLRPPGLPLAESSNARYFRDVMSQFALQRRSALLLSGSTETVGLSYPELRQRAAQADVLLNISGMLQDPALIERIPRRIYLDLDPAFNQLWHATQGIDMRFDGHTHFVTVGQAIGAPGCDVPTCERAWIPSLPPVVLANWPPVDPASTGAFTTVANWRGYGSIHHHDTFYGQKAHSLRRFMQVAAKTEERFLLALAIDPGEGQDLDALVSSGWHLADPDEAASTPDRYRRFIRESKAEFGVAKSGYVVSRCGWVSDRSACYLATGRPVLAQDTGFGTTLPTGKGLLRFESVEDALEGVRTIAGDYPDHCLAARQIAEEFLDSDKVLGSLLSRTGGVV